MFPTPARKDEGPHTHALLPSALPSSGPWLQFTPGGGGPCAAPARHPGTQNVLMPSALHLQHCIKLPHRKDTACTPTPGPAEQDAEAAEQGSRPPGGRCSAHTAPFTDFVFAKGNTLRLGRGLGGALPWAAVDTGAAQVLVGGTGVVRRPKGEMAPMRGGASSRLGCMAPFLVVDETHTHVRTHTPPFLELFSLADHLSRPFSIFQWQRPAFLELVSHASVGAHTAA